MANLNKVMLIGRLTRDPEKIEVRGEALGAKFGFAVNNRKLNQQTQQWEDIPVFIEMEIWNRGESKQADRVLQTLRKGQQIFIEGHLRYESWDDKNGGGKRNKLSVVVETFQYLERKDEGGGGSGDGDAPPIRAARPAATPPRQNAAPARAAASSKSYANEYDDEMPSGPSPGRSGGGGGGGNRGGVQESDDDIPF